MMNKRHPLSSIFIVSPKLTTHLYPYEKNHLKYITHSDYTGFRLLVKENPATILLVIYEGMIFSKLKLEGANVHKRPFVRCNSIINYFHN